DRLVHPVPSGRRAVHTYLVQPLRGARDEHTPEDSAAHETAQNDIELSVVMPCLNEADTLAICIRKARRAMDAAGIAGEVVIADNGSTDSSMDIAEAEGARVVAVADKGYGAALMGGIQ